MPPAMKTGLLATLACILEATARKPGNVHRQADFPGDAHYLDFLLSAAVIGESLNKVREQGVGATVLDALQATRSVVSTNTNLGILLLIAPLAQVLDDVPIRSGIEDVLTNLTIEDAIAVYRAIKLANPGGLGKVSAQDLDDTPTVTLLEAMKLAADHDLVARQYATNFADLFEITLPTMTNAPSVRFEWHGELITQSLETAIIASYLTLMSRRPDSLIARKRGIAVAEESARRAALALKSGHLTELDDWLRADGHARNPGASADLIAATLFVALRDGTIQLPQQEMSWQSIFGASR